MLDLSRCVVCRIKAWKPHRERFGYHQATDITLTVPKGDETEACGESNCSAQRRAAEAHVVSVHSRRHRDIVSRPGGEEVRAFDSKGRLLLERRSRLAVVREGVLMRFATDRVEQEASWRWGNDIESTCLWFLADPSVSTVQTPGWVAEVQIHGCWMICVSSTSTALISTTQFKPSRSLIRGTCGAVRPPQPAMRLASSDPAPWFSDMPIDATIVDKFFPR